MKEKAANRSECPLSCSLDIWGDKWSLLIIRDLVFYKKKTYGEFLQSDEKIATNILANRLKLLEESGILLKKDNPVNKVKNIYELTGKGIGLVPMLLEAYIWADENLEIPQEFRERIQKIKKDKQQFTDSLIAELLA